jgi:hypothetical protein
VPASIAWLIWKGEGSLLLRHSPGHAAGLNPFTAMFTFNGIGTRLYGKRDKDADGWYTATKFFCVLYFPIVPLSCHRVRKLDSSLLGGVTHYEMYPIDANIPQARNVYLLAYGLPFAIFVLLNLLGE